MSEQYEETLADLAATVDYIRDHVTERADSLDFDDAVALRDACVAVKDEAGNAISLIETAMLVHLEAGVQQRGSRVFKRKSKVAQRFRHDLIEAAIARIARRLATDDEGVTSPARAVDAALRLMHQTYLAPSTKAKVGQLDAMEVDRKAVIETEFKGYELVVETLDERQD